MYWSRVLMIFSHKVQGSLFGHQIVLVVVSIEHSRVGLKQGLSSYLHQFAEFADCEPYFTWIFIGSMHGYDFHVSLDIDNRLCLGETIPPFFCFVIDLHNPLGWLIVQLFFSCPLAKLFISDIELVNTPYIQYLFCLFLFSASLIWDLDLALLCSDLLHFVFRLSDFLASALRGIFLRGLHLHFRRLALNDVGSFIIVFIFEVEVVAAVHSRFLWQCFSASIYLVSCSRFLRVATGLRRLGLTLLLEFLLVGFEEVQAILQIFDRFPCGFIGRVPLPLDLVLSDQPIYLNQFLPPRGMVLSPSMTSTQNQSCCSMLIWQLQASKQGLQLIQSINSLNKTLLCTWQLIHFNHCRTPTGPVAPSSSAGS